MKSVKCILVLALILGVTATPCFAQTGERKLNIDERMIHRRAIEVIVWSQPLMNYKAMRDAFFANGANYNDVTYYSKLQNWKWQIATPNSTTPYVFTFWNLKDGPVVVEIPASTADVGIFGTLMESWQRPLEDVGAKGKDGGRGGKYVILPPDYRGPLLPGSFTIQSQTYQGYTAMRPIMKSPSPENLAKAAAFVKQLKVYPLADDGKEAKTRHIDLYDKAFEGITKWDASYFEGLSDILQEEKIEERDLGYWGMAATIGIQKGVPYKADAKRKKLLDEAAAEALEFIGELRQLREFSRPRSPGSILTGSRSIYAGAFTTRYAPAQRISVAPLSTWTSPRTAKGNGWMVGRTTNSPFQRTCPQGTSGRWKSMTWSRPPGFAALS